MPGRPKRDEKRKDRRSRIYSARSLSDSVAGGSTRTAAYAAAAGLLPTFSTSSSFREVSLPAVLRKRDRKREDARCMHGRVGTVDGKQRFRPESLPEYGITLGPRISLSANIKSSRK